MEEWNKPIYKKLASSELGAGHTSGIVPAKETESYFGVPKQESSHLITKIFIDFWAGDKSKIITVNVTFFKSSTHRHIHLTGNLLPVYKGAGAEVGDVVVFWKSQVDPNTFKAELIKQGSERWNEAGGDKSFSKAGGFIDLVPPGGGGYDESDSEYELPTEVEDEITVKDFPTTTRQGRKKQGERMVTVRNKAKGDFVLKQQKYKCQVNPLHESFITKAGLPYMEKHHLISMMYYEEYENDLDDISNIVSICPNCHRQIHLGDRNGVEKIIEVLHEQQKEKLNSAGLSISLEELKSRYKIN